MAESLAHDPNFSYSEMVAAHAAGFERKCRDGVADQETGSFIETNDRETRV